MVEKSLPSKLPTDEEDCFKTLCKIGYRVTSDAVPTHNCIAFAVGDYGRKWAPSVIPIPGYYWPKGIRRDEHPDALRDMFAAQGYEICTTAELESGYEKVAIYVDNNGHWSHAAKQESNGEWACKLGDSYDIKHKSPHCFGDSIYGQVIYFMRRKLREVASEGQESKEEESKGTVASKSPDQHSA